MPLDIRVGPRAPSVPECLSFKATIPSEPVPDFEALAEPIRKDFRRYHDLSRRGDNALLTALHRAGVEFFPVVRRNPADFDKAQRKKGIRARILEIQAIVFLFGNVDRKAAHKWARAASWLGKNCAQMTSAEMLKVAKDKRGMSGIANIVKKQKEAQEARATLMGMGEPENEVKLFEEIQAVLESVEPNILIRPAGEFGGVDDKISLYLGVRYSSGHEGIYEVPLTDGTDYRRFAMAIRRESEPVRTIEATWDEVEDAADQGVGEQEVEEAEAV
jgi:hypothetical protein